jgi:hypothetical protein
MSHHLRAFDDHLKECLISTRRGNSDMLHEQGSLCHENDENSDWFGDSSTLWKE